MIGRNSDGIRSAGAWPPRGVITTGDQLMAVWTTWILLATIVIWTASGGSGGPAYARIDPNNHAKYIIYSLPLTLSGAYWLSFGVDRIRIDERGLAALGIYSVLAVTGIAANSWTEFYAIRDLTIICSYLLLFVFWFRAPDSAIDVCLVALALCQVIELAIRFTPGVTLIDADSLYAMLGLANPSVRYTALIGPHSLLESTLGFPLGVIVLYYVHNRRWRLALMAGFLLLLAFKRISFAGVIVALTFDAITRNRTRLRSAKRMAALAAIGLSITAIYSVLVFQSAADALQLKNSSADAISLGRYDIALLLWSRWHDASVLNWLIGFGAGAADSISEVFQSNPHNDWLKILFDYGVIGFLVIHAVFFLIFARHRVGLMIYLYNTVLMMPDNVFIYMYHYPFIALIMCAERE